MSLSQQPSASTSIARGAVLVIAMRWTDRLIGIASTLILARLLVPADFGIVAMASLVVALIDTLLDLGVNAALVQNRNASREDFDVAWTLRLIQSLCVAALIGLVGAPLAADYFNDGRVTAVLWIMALTVLVGGCENIGIVAFQKNMEFGREFRFTFLRRLAGFLATICLAFWLRSYWAMIFGALIGRLTGIWLSYAMHDFRPRLSLRRIGALWSFSQWMLVRNLGTYGAQQVDKLIVGRRAGASGLGVYSLADDIAAMPTGELLAPIGRVLFPAFVRVADDPQQLRETFALALGVQSLVALPAGVGLALVAHSAVPLLLGPQWMATIPLIQILALINIATALTHSSSYLLLALGRVRIQAMFAWLQFALLASLVILAFPTAEAEAIARIRLGVATAGMLAFLAMALHAVPGLRWRDFWASTWRPALATAAMAAMLTWWPVAPTLPLALRLAAEVGAGGTAYAATILLLWWLSGCRGGAERYLLDKLRPQAVVTTDVSPCRTIDELPASARVLMETSGQPHLESSPWWFDHLQRSVFTGDPGVRYYVAHRNEECVAVLPIRLSRRGHVRVVESLANYYTSLYNPPLRASATPGDIAAVLSQATREHRNPNEMRFAPMDPDSAAYRLLLSALRTSGWVPFRYFCFGNWHLKVDSEWPEYLRNRPGTVKSTVKRMSKKFLAAGGTLEIIHSVEDIEAAAAAYVEIYSASWKIPEPYPEFMPGLIRYLAASGRLRLGIARLRGRPIAAQVWAVQSGRASIIKLAHREDSTEHSPGTLLTAHLMEHVISIDRVREVDYLTGDDPYKQNWMSHRRERWGIVAYNPRTWVGLLLLIRELTARAAKVLVQSSRRLSASVRAASPTP